MPRAFPGFESYPTHHCVTGSMKHVYDFHGHPISEEMLLGLGRGLGFVYFREKGFGTFLGGRANNISPKQEGLEVTAGRRTGVVVESHVTASARKAQSTLRELLDAGEPVMLQADMGLLPYFDFPEEYHFGGHVIAAVGYDADTGQVLIADRDTEPHPVAWDDLERARASTFKPFPPKHRWFTFDFSAARPPTSGEILDAIHEVCTAMLEPPISNIGVRGIRKAAVEIAKWPQLMDGDELRRTCFTTAIYIDARGGTGGGIFRTMYGRFLQEAAVATGVAALADAGERAATIGDRWDEVAAVLAKAAGEPAPAALLADVVGLLPGIADEEQRLWENLRGVIAAAG